MAETPRDPSLLPFEVSSDGFGNGTDITINGVPTVCIESLKYEVDAQGFATLTLVAVGVPAHLVGLAEVTVIQHPDEESSNG